MNITYDTLGLRQYGAVPFKRAVGSLTALGVGSALGSVAAGVAGSVIGSSATDNAAEKALQSTQDTNATNLQIARENNEKAIELQEQQNMFNVEQWNRNNEYNSPFAQRDRLLAAGYNPNMFGNNSQYTPSPVQQTSIPNLTTPQMQNAADVYLQSGLAKGQYYANMFQQAAEIGKTVAEIGNIKEDTETKYTYNQFAADLHRSGIEVNQATARKMYADINESVQRIQNMRATIAEINARIANMDADTKGKTIDNLYKGEVWDATVKKLKSECGFNDAQIDYIKQKLPYELGLMDQQTKESRSRTALNYANVEVAHTQSDLNRALAKESQSRTTLNAAELKQVEQTVEVLKIQTNQQAFDYLLSTAFDTQDRLYDQEIKREQWNAAKWENNTFSRSVRAAGAITGAVANGVGAVKGTRYMPTYSVSSSRHSQRFDFSGLSGVYE